MAYKDLHEEPFDEATITKLEIFEDYAQAWIPTFVMSKINSTICIFDFFAGTGYDKNRIEGSPIRLLKKIREQTGNIFQKKIKIKLYLNELEREKFIALQKACSNYAEENKEIKRMIDSNLLELHLLNEDFEILFPKLLSEIKQFPSLVYLDQNGIKFLHGKYFSELEKTSLTDFLYFVSSSYFWRFGDRKEFKEYLDMDMTTAKKDPYRFIHKNIIQQLRKNLPSNSKLKLYPFSLRKGPNIHGIIFGASHPLAVDKFLSLAWKRNESNGEANFDMYGDVTDKQLDFFSKIKLNKIQEFKANVKNKVLSEEIKNNFELLNYTYNEGHIGKHASDCLKEMKEKGEITYEGSSPLVNYINVYKNRKLTTYKIIKH